MPDWASPVLFHALGCAEATAHAGWMGCHLVESSALCWIWEQSIERTEILPKSFVPHLPLPKLQTNGMHNNHKHLNLWLTSVGGFVLFSCTGEPVSEACVSTELHLPSHAAVNEQFCWTPNVPASSRDTDFKSSSPEAGQCWVDFWFHYPVFSRTLIKLYLLL